MAKLKTLYKCNMCGNIAEIHHESPVDLMCCGKIMDELVENLVDAAVEKHVPVVERNGSEVTIKVGSVEHPMTDDHYIEFIELLTENKTYLCYLKPNQKPECTFNIGEEKIVKARAYCNLHGLWKN